MNLFSSSLRSDAIDRKRSGNPQPLVRWATIINIMAAVALLSGCATPGPVHLYTIAPHGTDVHDVAITTDVARDVPSYIASSETLTGFAYDPFTDHFFLRLLPGNVVRVVDRPARKIKREFAIEGVPADGSGGDLAVNPRDGHLFLVNPAAPELFETTRLGKKVRTLSLHGRTAPIAAIAYDSANDQLVALDDDARTIRRYDLDGRELTSMTLEHRVRSSLALDSASRMIYAPLGDQSEVGVFEETGKCVKTLQISPGDKFIDVGPHSFLRVF